MKKVLYILWGILSLCLPACNEDTELETFIPNNISPVSFSRNVHTPTTLADGDSVLFSAQGGLSVNNQLLTYSNGEWTSTLPLQWSNAPVQTTFTALYPVYEDHLYTQQKLYTDNGLEDILIAQDTLNSRQTIEFSFKHLFSQLVIHVTSSIQEKLDSLKLIVPCTVTSIANDGTISVDAAPHTTSIPANESGSYSFLLPPMKDCQLTLKLLTTSDESYTNVLPAYTFEDNMKYECKLRNTIGILTAKDLIAFSQLINGKKVEGRTLDEFGAKVGEDSVFYLLSDIALSPEDCEDLLPIGYNDSKGFKYIFEGNNHTISGLIVPDASTNRIVNSNYSGLFGHITSNGIVQNLHIANATSVSTPTCKRIGILSGTNNGTIINCSVTGSSITSTKDSRIQGAISAYSTGTIANCYTFECKIKNEDVSCYTGAIAGEAGGIILNCYVYNNIFTTNSSSFSGGLVGQSNSNIPLSLSNCCVYHNSSQAINSTNKIGAIIGYAQKATIANSYFNKGKNTYRDPSKSSFNNCEVYSNYSINGKHLSTYLNEWVDNEEKNPTYPNIKFKKWTTDTTTLPTFQ